MLSRVSLPQDLKNPIEEFVEEYVLRYSPSRIKDEKIIHDTLWGTQKLKPWEVALLDTPLIQRLRQIRQMVLTYLTYPLSVYTRMKRCFCFQILNGIFRNSV
jgi:hypothetical protein